MVLQRLCVRADSAALGVGHTHRIGNDVEDGLELCDASAESFSQLFALTDVVAGEENTAAARTFGEHDERRFDESSAAALLKWNANRARPRRAAHRRVDLIGEIGERVRERVVDRDFRRLRRRNSRELAVARVRARQPQIAVKNRDRKRDRLE